jgi:hypothetical protein
MKDLRPQTIVQLVDTTVSIAGRFFVPLFALSVLVEGPLDILTYIDPAHRDTFDFFAKTPKPALAAGASFHGWTAQRILGTLAEPFAISAVAIAIAGYLRAGSVDLALDAR